MSQSTRKNSTRSKRFTVEISIIIALIGFAATVTAATINYCSSRYPVEQSLKATQKAEERYATLISGVQTPAVVVIEITVTPAATTTPPPSPTPTATLEPTPTWTATSAPSPSPSPTESALDWRSRLEIRPTWYPCEYRMLPAYINLEAGTEETAAQIEAASQAGEYLKWDLGPLDKSFILTLDITNISPDIEWIRLSKTASISVQSVGDLPEQTTMVDMHGCGGGGLYRDFTAGSLASRYKSYDFEVIYPDPEVDFFKLEQGEFESFIFTFDCTEPGIYRLEIRIPYSQKGVEGEIVYADRQELVCPAEYSGYEYVSSFDSPGGVADLRFEGTFTWDGTEYLVKP